jgi:hypothetical protein
MNDMIYYVLKIILYHPLEAMIIIGLINVLSNIKMSKVDFIKNSYILGFINFLIMRIPTFFEPDTLIRMIADNLIIILYGIVAYLFYKLYLKIRIRKFIVVKSFMIFFITTALGLFLFNLLFENAYSGNRDALTFSNYWYELIANLIPRMIGYLSIVLIKLKGENLEGSN